jgi:hypothetical protein
MRLPPEALCVREGLLKMLDIFDQTSDRKISTVEKSIRNHREN